MKTLLFSAQGRINRGKFWLAILYFAGIALLFGIGTAVLKMMIPGSVADDGTIDMSGPAMIPYAALLILFVVVSVWGGLCIGIKRYHDRGKSGWWVLIQLVPAIGALWYFIEAGCLAGTPGPNRYGPDPLA